MTNKEELETLKRKSRELKAVRKELEVFRKAFKLVCKSDEEYKYFLTKARGNS